MYLVCKPGGGISLSHFTLSQRDIRWVDLFGTIARNVPKERLVRLYLNIYPQNVPTAQMKSNCVGKSEQNLRNKCIILLK